VLSIALPLPMIALAMFTRRHDIMGEFANSTRVNVIALAGTVIVLALNLLLVLQTFGIPIPGLPAAD
jgi:manganese transport protein